MAAIADLSDLINRATGGASGTPQTPFWFKTNRISGAAAPATIAGRHVSLWQYDGMPGSGAVPTAVAVPTNATVGALPFTNPGGGRTSWLLQNWMVPSQTGTFLLYDRLLHIGGLSGTTITAQNVGGTLTRNTGGVTNFAFIEIYSLLGTTGTTVAMSYTNELGTSGRIGPTVVIGGTGFREQTRAIMLPLVAGDKGIRAVANVDLVATTGTAGNFGVVVGKPIGYLGGGGIATPVFRDYVTGLPGIPSIEPDACLAAMFIPTGTTAPEFMGGYSIVEA